jgi:hypothetical protein
MSGVVLHLYKHPGGVLKAADADSAEYVKKLTEGEVIESKVRRARNYQFHKKFFALLAFAFDNQEKYDTPEAFRAEVTMRAGWYQEHHHLSGAISYSPKSIAFDKMDELEFGRLYQAVIDVILKHFLHGMTEPALRAATAEEIARFAG